MAEIEQLFWFETGHCVFDDGTKFCPLEDAEHRWQCRSRIAMFGGTNLEVLYETPQGKYVHFLCLHCEEREVETSDDDDAPPRRLWVASGIKGPNLLRALDAKQFVEAMRGEITESLKQNLEREREEASRIFAESIKRRETPTRPLEAWKALDKLPVLQSETAHDIAYPELARKLYRNCVDLVQFLKKPTEHLSPHARLTTHGPCETIAGKLFAGYRVDPEQWWGSADIVPPVSVGVADLEWPDDFRGFRSALIALQVTIEESAHCLAFRRDDESFAYVESPTDADTRLAIDAMRSKLDAIERATVAMGKALRQLALLGRETTEVVSPEERDLPNYVRKALNSFMLANETLLLVTDSEATDDAAYKWLQENGPLEYELPDLTTWKRYLRMGRNASNTQKNQPRATRKGRSVISPDEI